MVGSILAQIGNLHHLPALDRSDRRNLRARIEHGPASKLRDQGGWCIAMESSAAECITFAEPQVAKLCTRRI